MAQTAIFDGISTGPDNSAMLDVQGDDTGILIPRVNLSSTSSFAPVVGTAVESLLIYNTNATIGKGYYYWDGAAWLKIIAGNATPLSGSGLANRVTYWSGPSSLTSNGNFTYSPVGNLSVLDAESTGGEVRIGAAWGRPGLYSSQRLELQSGTTGILFGNGNVEYMRMTAAGNLGIGSTNAAGKLHVVTANSDGNVGAWGPGQLVVGQDGTTAGGLGLSYSTTNNAGYISSLSPAVAWRNLGFRALNTIFYYNGATEGMRLTNAGDVGIGIAIPVGKLDVRVAGAGAWDRLVVKPTSLWGDGLVAPAENGGTEYVTIGAGGASGIMINNPHVVWNSGNASAGIRYGRSGGVSAGYWWESGVNVGGGYHIRKTAVAATGIDILNNGNVGIGLAAPSSKLEILHNTTLANGMYDASNIEVVTNNASNPSIGFHRSGHSATALYHAGYGNNSLRIRNADGLDAALLHEGNLSTYGIQNQYTTGQSANHWITGIARADGVMRAPWFTVSDYNGGIPGGDGSFYRTAGQAEISFDDWMYMRDASDNSIRIQYYLDNGGQIILGPNTGWSRYLRLGGNANQTDEANIATTDGNLHLDNRAGHAIYLNHYANNWVRMGNGATGYHLTGSFEQFDDDNWFTNRYAPNDRVYLKTELGLKETLL